jgi:lipoprotein-anchoring transpeptidase ErfK/SrfK
MELISFHLFRYVREAFGTKMKPYFSIVITLLLLAGHALAAPGIMADAINRADLPNTAKGIQPGIIKAEVLLDRLHFSPGIIDGTGGDNFRKAFAAFKASQKLEGNGQLDQTAWAILTSRSDEPVIVDYIISDADEKGPFTPNIPLKMEDMAKLPNLGYRNPIERLAEKFHMDEKLLKVLNPGKTFTRTGETISVANVAREDNKGARASKVEVDKASKMVRAIGMNGELLATYPASIGSQVKPAPSGSYQIRNVVKNPTYHYNPQFKFKGVKSSRPFTIRAGPNNPVGSVWIDLSLDSYGIHGTPDPSKVSKAYSHGCVRLTNWDVEELAKLVKKGTPVEFID